MGMTFHQAAWQQQTPRLVWSLLIYALKDARAFHT